MTHYRVTGSNRVPSARFPHEPFPHLPLCWLRFPVQQRYLLSGRAGKLSVYIHDTENGQQQVVREGEAGWVFQDVVSRAAFRRVPRNGEPYFTMMSLHIKNHYATRRGIAKNVLETVPGNWADVCGFIKPPNTDSEWQIRGHGAFEINRDVLGIRPTDQSCHHELWIHLSHINARLVDQYRTRNAVRSEQDRRQGKKRGNPYDNL